MNRDLSHRRGGRFRGRLAAAVLTAATLIGGGAVAAGQAGAATTVTAPKVVSGWPGGIKSYQGRYKLVKASTASFAKSGELTLFGRFVKGLTGLQLSGILALYTSDGTNALYVTHFEQVGAKLTASVNLGIYTGPVIGAFNLVTRKGAAVTARFVPTQGAPVTLTFKRISTDPHP
jgi:hypothetical protein